MATEEFLLQLWDKVPISRNGRFWIRWAVSNRKFIVGANAIILDKEERVLLFRHTYANPQPWGLPGTIVGGEEIIEVLCSRIEKESGLAIKVHKDLGVIHGLRRRLDFQFLASVVEGEFRRSAGVREAMFFPLDQMPEGLGPYPRAILETLAGGELSPEARIDPNTSIGYARVRVDTAVSDRYVEKYDKGEEVILAPERDRHINRVFADEYSALSHKIAEAVSSLLLEQPLEDASSDFEPIVIEEDDRRKGATALFFSGALIDPDREEVYLSSRRDRTVLTRLGVKFRPAV